MVMRNSKAKIEDGVWTRRISCQWERTGEWRADIFKSVLSDPRLRTAKFVLDSGAIAYIPATELRRVLEGGAAHYLDNKIWGPFNINPTTRTVDGQGVEMNVETPN
jgi:hypothetical protein